MAFRIGGAFPFGIQALPVALPSGGQFYLPPGHFLVSLGHCSVLQFFDPQQMMWRSYGAPYSQSTPISCDGANWRIVNLSGVVIGAAITNAGTTGTNGIGAAATGAAVTFGAAPSNGQAAAAYPIVGGAINTTIAITQAGSGFLVPPLLLIDAPPQGGIQATARCTISSAGVINAVTVDNAGAGYTSAPGVSILPQYAAYPGAQVPPGATTPVGIPPGLIAQGALPDGIFGPGLVAAVPDSGGALLTVNATLAGSGTLTGIVVTQFGAGYAGTTIPTITVTGVGAAAATAIMSMSVASVTVGNAGAAVSVAPIWRTSLGQIARINNNNLLLGRGASGGTTLSTTTVGANVVEDPGFGLQSVPGVAYSSAGGTPWTTDPAGVAVVGGITDVSIIQPAI